MIFFSVCFFFVRWGFMLHLMLLNECLLHFFIYFMMVFNVFVNDTETSSYKHLPFYDRAACDEL